jgi:uncharacterized protein
MKTLRALGLAEARITGGFWAGKLDMVAREMLPYQWKALNDEVPGAEPSRAIENFRIAAGESSGEFKSTLYQDSEVAKWIEAASYSLSHHADPELEARVDEAVRLIAKAQRPDGYVNTYFSVAAPDKRWQDLAWGHELYSAGHLIEAAVAHKACTGKDVLLDVARRLADCIARAFGTGPGQIRGVCGHPEIELALFRLYRSTGEARYRDLAEFFVEERGRDPAAFDGKEPLGFVIPKTRWISRDYFLNHEPLRAQSDATGHAVRAVYMYSAMADEYAASGDPRLLEALRTLWDSVVSRRMYVTAGIGSQAHGERFTCDYDLPSDTAYAETCASIGLAFWASRMTTIEGDSRYADVLERALYNGILSGVSLDGTRYFYVNPLEALPAAIACRQDHEHVKGSRVQWFGCSCCPPNIARLVASQASYLYGISDGAVWVHHYAQSEAEASVGGARVRVGQETDYPWSGGVSLSVEPDREAEFELRLRIPDWCGGARCSVGGELYDGPMERGYLVLRRRWKPGDRVELDLDMRCRVLEADPRIPELAGRLAVQRGPIIYCAESIDNGDALHSLVLDPDRGLEAEYDPSLMGGAVRLRARAFREYPAEVGRSALPYGERKKGRVESVQLMLVPYHMWGNRSPGGEMRVWMRGVS